MSKRTKRIVIWSMLAASLVALALPKVFSEDSEAASGGGAPAGGARAVAASGGRGGGGAPAAVRALVVSTGQLDDGLRATGTLLPNEQVELQPETNGKITGIYFREGEMVPRGKVLVRINDAELRAQHKRAVHRRTLAAAKEARSKQLLEKNAVSAADYDVALSELQTANAEIELIQAQLDKTVIRAPFSGRIGFRQVSVGSYIAPTTRIATLSSTDPVKLEFFVPERYQSMVRPGSIVSFSVDGSQQERTGKVYAIEPRIEAETRTLQVRATAPNPGGQLMAGAFAQVSLRLSRTADAITVPSEAIIPEAGGKSSVYTVAQGKAERREVELGQRTDRSVQILAGLAAGDTVIVAGVQVVKPGAPVRVSIVEEG